MYLTKFALDIREPDVRRCLYNCQDMHRSVMRLFGCSRKDAGVLYRINRKNMSLYILSEIRPDESLANKGFKFEGARDISALAERFREGKVFRFNVKTYPCTQHQGKRSFIRTPEGRLAWFRSVAEKNGFALLSLQESPEMEKISGNHEKEVGGRFVYQTVVFTGVLRIVDADKFVSVYSNGIGRGLAYGLGMLFLY